MRTDERRFQLRALGRRHLREEKFAEIKTDAHAVDADESGHVFDVIDVTMERRFFRAWTNEDRVHSDDAPARADHPDLRVAHIALHIVEAPRIAVRHNQWP